MLCLQFSFITETATNRSLPQDAEFWDQLFAEAVRWGLEVYEQDWQDRQTVDMVVTHTNFTAARDWLLLMGAGAAEEKVALQYCMSLPRHVLQSAGEFQHQHSEDHNDDDGYEDEDENDDENEDDNYDENEDEDEDDNDDYDDDDNDVEDDNDDAGTV